MRDVAKEYNIEVIDGGYFLDNTPGVYMDFCHFNENGHEIIAHLFYESITKMSSRKIINLDVNSSK